MVEAQIDKRFMFMAEIDQSVMIMTYNESEFHGPGKK